MEDFEIKNENIKNEDSIIVDYDLLEDLINSGIKNCVFKLKFKVEIENNQPATKVGTGFFCNIPNKCIKAFITNNHVINQEFLNNEKKLILYNNKDEKKEINLELNRYKFTDKDLDFTVIEILEDDNITNYLEIDEFIDSTDYKHEQICSLNYSGGRELQYSHGENYGIKQNYFLYSIGTLGGSSGAPIILINNKKVIGLHKAGYYADDKKNKEKKINIGIPMNLIINKININNAHDDSKYIKDPRDLKFKFDIITTNDYWGANDLFEIFSSKKDNMQYIVSANIYNYQLDIISLLNNKTIFSLKGHKRNITTIRYFPNNKNDSEYLISADKYYIVIIWDIDNNYDIKYSIDTSYKDVIYSSLLLFPHNSNENYIITSTKYISNDLDKACTKIYSFNTGNFIKNINDSNNYRINYLLSWNNEINDKYYIIQFVNNKILINEALNDNSLYCELIQDPEEIHYHGLIYKKNNIDYLYSSSKNGYIHIWDLYSKQIIQVINSHCYLVYLIIWNDNYMIAADKDNKSFKIFDIEKNKIISEKKGVHKGELTCLKKVLHPIYGESLLTGSWDKTIKLWCI